MELRETLESYVDDYFESMDRLDFERLARRQQGRLASLSDGAAGIAWAHLHAAAVLGDDRRLEGAARWAQRAWRRRDDPLSFFPTAGGPRRQLAGGAFLFGLVGVVAVRALVAEARGERGELERALEDFAAACRPPSESSGLFVGTAGALQATALLLAATGDERMLPLGRELAVRLSAQAAPLDGRPIAWRAHPGPGLAHGAAGVLMALLSWCVAAAAPVPPPARAAVDGLLGAAFRDPQSFCPQPTFLASVCNGFSGLAALALAVPPAGERLAAARRAVELALASLPPRPDLCCGRAGAAAACLALAGVDPHGPWRRHATELTLSTLLWAAEDWELSGLYGGEAGVVCLAADLLAGAPSGLPGLSLPRAGGGGEAAVCPAEAGGAV